jgi:CYTH domain-containing protein
MGIEIERKFLVHKAIWNKVSKGKGAYLKQGYIVTDPTKTIRVRIADEQGYLTIKGKSTGIARQEFEYEIPKHEASELLQNFTTSSLEKIRYRLQYLGKTWEVDEFLDLNEGLIVAEIELESENEKFEIPEWIDKEVSGDKKYYNSYLSQFPFKSWK